MIEKAVLNIISSIGSVKSLFIHTGLFVGSFCLYFLGVEMDSILSVVTNIVSLEAIYLSILIQMSVNFQSKKLELVAADVEDLQEDVEDIQSNVEDIQENVEDIQENVEDMQEDDDDEDDDDLKEIRNTLEKLMKEVVELKHKKSKDSVKK